MHISDPGQFAVTYTLTLLGMLLVGVVIGYRFGHRRGRHSEQNRLSRAWDQCNREKLLVDQGKLRLDADTERLRLIHAELDENDRNRLS